MLTAIALTVLAILCRLCSPVFHTWNFVPMGAVALFAGSRLPRRWAWLVPVAALILSDIALDYGTQRPLFELSRWTVYATIAATSLLGPIANLPKIGRWLLPFLALGGSTLFFLTTNLATWAEGQNYPLTLPGLVQCYILALPFFGSTILADLLGTGLLFGLGPAFERLARRLLQPRLSGSPHELSADGPSQTA
ncbi:MAG TPA: DUF6580 family putative transport protein [Isosphaeraceae bacterium]|nr:DUF6580 family putative transport protein [Isosphaeraceae bacterium]